MEPKPTSSSIADFCMRHGISQTTFYRRRSGMPETIKVGSQLRIIDQDERDWIKQLRSKGASS